MSFLAPLALVGLVTLPIIVAFYMLRLRRDERTVSSTYLWQRLVRDVEANSPWQRLRRSLLLLLQLLAALLLVAIVARPVLERPAGLARDLVIVVDASASMSATDVFPDRLAAAKRAAIDALRDLPSDGKVSVVAATETARVVANEAADAGRAARAIESIESSTAATDLRDAMTLAGALAARATGAEVLVVTDGAGAMPVDVRIDAPVRVITVGRERDNQAIAALAVRSDPSGLQRQVFVSISNYSTGVVPRRLQLLADGIPFTARDLRLAALSKSDVIIDEVPRGARVIEARLDVADEAPPMASPGTGIGAGGVDHLAIDDVAWAIAPDDRPVSILLIGQGNVYLQNALSLLPNVELYGVTAEEWASGTGGDQSWDLVVLDGVVPAELPETPILAIGPPASSPLGEVTGSVADPPVGEPSAEEPLLRNVDLSRLHISRAQRMTTPDWARVVLASSADVPLVYSGQRSGLATTVITFDLHQSDLPLQVAWPILASNITAELLGRDARASDPMRPASPVEIPLRPGAIAARVTLPDGTVREVAEGATGAGSVTFVETRLVGVYRVELVPGPQAGTPAGSEAPGSTAPPTSDLSASPGAVGGSASDLSWFAVDLFSQAESDITPTDGSGLSALGTGVASDPQAAGTARDEWWPIVTLVLLVVLMGEWLLYERDGARRITAGVRSAFQGARLRGLRR